MNLRKENKNFKYFAYIFCALFVLILDCLVAWPIMLQISTKEHYISYDTWVQFFGSVGGALLGGTITGLGLYISIGESRKMLKVQIISDEIKYLTKYRSLLEDLNSNLFEISVYIENLKSDNIKTDKFNRFTDKVGSILQEMDIIQFPVIDDDVAKMFSNASSSLHDAIRYLKNLRGLEDLMDSEEIDNELLQGIKTFGKKCSKPIKEYDLISKEMNKDILELSMNKRNIIYKF